MYALTCLQNKPKNFHESISFRYHLYLICVYKLFLRACANLYTTFCKPGGRFPRGVMWLAVCSFSRVVLYVLNLVTPISTFSPTANVYTTLPQGMSSTGFRKCGIQVTTSLRKKGCSYKWCVSSQNVDGPMRRELGQVGHLPYLP